MAGLRNNFLQLFWDIAQQQNTYLKYSVYWGRSPAHFRKEKINTIAAIIITN
jgi:hypothetical protein